jgi:hypothetical protein
MLGRLLMRGLPLLLAMLRLLATLKLLRGETVRKPRGDLSDVKD